MFNLEAIQIRHAVLIFSICVIGSTTNIFCQTKFPAGVYMSIDELKAKNPSRHDKLLIKERTGGDIGMNGGNDFKVESTDGLVTKKFIKKNIVAISDGSSLYINGIHFDFQFWYAKVEIESDAHLIFRGGVSNAEATSAAVAGGGIGGAVIAAKRYVYAFDKDFVRKELINKERLIQILADRPELLSIYQKEDHPNKNEVIMKYLPGIY